ncbi:MAG: peptidoglycan-binding protein [Nostoc sp.]|uniref:peptidoglycan-binding domain-containing protein n=1 Tax=Nostoc sp. TaxID=1180 RepID=UPI002FF7A4EB
MWCGFGKSSATFAVTCLVTASLVIADTGFAASQKSYTPQQFRAVLRGLGYNVKVTNSALRDEETKKAIREFQTGYKLKPVDGIAGPKTQDFAANIVQILHRNLNAVLKPNPPLPRDHFYGSRTEEVVKEYQKKYQLQETGIANLALRQKLNEEAKTVFSQPAATPTTTPTTKPTAKPTTKPTAKPTSTPTTPTSTPTTPTSTPTTPTSTPTTPTSTPNTPTSTPTTPTSTPTTPTSTPTTPTSTP